MPFKRIPLTEAMAEDVVQIYIDAFGRIAGNRAMLPNKGPETVKILINRERESIRKATSDDYYFAIVDTDIPSTNPAAPEGKIVAYNKWKLERPEKQWDHVPEADIPGANMAARSRFFDLINHMRAKQTDGKLYWHLAYLATYPEHERRGIGAMCMEWGLAKADELSLPSYIDSTAAGVPLYTKYGFQVADSFEMVWNEYGVDGRDTTYSMWRPAPKP